LICPVQAVFIQGDLYRIQQILLPERFGKEFDSAGLHGTH
jgi:hypothetical protein